MRRLIATTTCLALSCLCATASAHTGGNAHLHDGFLAGFLHPLTGADHLVALLSVGAWSAVTLGRNRNSLWSPAWFVILMMVGAVAGWQGLRLSGVEPLIAASLLVIGLLLATRLSLPPLLAALAMGGFALFHGLAHGMELPASQPGATLMGLLLASVLLQVAGLLAGWAMRRQAWLTRSSGAVVALLGGAALLPWVA